MSMRGGVQWVTLTSNTPLHTARCIAQNLQAHSWFVDMHAVVVM